ncbi:MAG TPA: hypothetical protein VF576_04815 [Rubricoccaceae bacterium]
MNLPAASLADVVGHLGLFAHAHPVSCEQEVTALLAGAYHVAR